MTQKVRKYKAKYMLKQMQSKTRPGPLSSPTFASICFAGCTTSIYLTYYSDRKPRNSRLTSEQALSPSCHPFPPSNPSQSNSPSSQIPQADSHHPHRQPQHWDARTFPSPQSLWNRILRLRQHAWYRCWIAWSCGVMWKFWRTMSDYMFMMWRVRLQS